MQVPIADLKAKNGTIGVWASVERRTVTTRGQKTRDRGGWVQVNYTGPKAADVLRLNLGIPVTANPDRLGVLGGDTQGWPNGRRLGDEVIDIAEQAVGGFLRGTKLPLGDGVNGDDAKLTDSFPYIADPASGFANSKGLQKPSGHRSGGRQLCRAPDRTVR